jgi:hypothetical protein
MKAGHREMKKCCGLSFEARRWEQEKLRELGLEDVPWEPSEHCPWCGGATDEQEHDVAAVEESGPKSGPRPIRWWLR